MLTGVSYKCSATSSWKYSTSSSKKYFLPRKRKGESKKTSNSMWTTSRKLSQAIRSSLRTKPKWTFPRMSISSYNWPSRQSSGLGTIQGPFLTGKSTKSLDCWERKSMSSPWCSGNMGETSGTGVAIHQKPKYWRKISLWRNSYERSGRGCRCRHQDSLRRR